jgi:putative membrane protein
MPMADPYQRRVAALPGMGSHATVMIRHWESLMNISIVIRLLVLCATLSAAFASQSISPTKSDITFVDKAIIGGLVEIRSAEIAMNRNLTPQEKAFAQEIVTDHLRLNKELGDMARMKSIAAPDELPADEQEKLLALSKTDDREFNEKFLNIMISRHKDAVDLFDEEQSTTKDPDFRPLVVKMLPQLRLHLDAARQLVARY